MFNITTAMATAFGIAALKWLFLFVAIYVTFVFITKLVAYSKSMQSDSVASSMMTTALIDSLYIFIMIL